MKHVKRLGEPAATTYKKVQDVSKIKSQLKGLRERGGIVGRFIGKVEGRERIHFTTPTPPAIL